MRTCLRPRACVRVSRFQVAAGGIRIENTMGANIGPQVYVFNFTTAGISVKAGHETMIHESWLGEYWWDDAVRWWCWSRLETLCFRGHRLFPADLHGYGCGCDDAWMVVFALYVSEVRVPW